MSELKTPVRYEPALDELNIGVRLKVTDKVRPVLPIPILNLNPVSENRPPIGKLLRCNNQGAVLKSGVVGYGSYQVKTAGIVDWDPNYTVTFDQKFYSLLFESIDSAGDYDYYLCDSDYSVNFFKLPKANFMRLPIRGTTLYFRSEGTSSWENTFKIYAFY